MFFSKAVLVILSLAPFSVLATPHALNHLHHRAIAARVALQPPPSNNTTVTPLRKRQNARRCRQRSTSSSSSTSTLASPPLPTHTTTTTQHQVVPVVTPKSSPTPTPVQQPTTPVQQPTTTAAQPASGSGPSYLNGEQVGQGTFYATGLGACGITNNDNQFIAAVSHLLFDTYPGYDGINPNTNPVCNKQVKATYQGASVTVTITDRCTGCAITDLDFSPAAFNTLAQPSVGRISGMTWVWV